MQHIGDALKLMLDNSNWKSKYLQSKVEQDWEMLMGTIIAKYTQHVKFIDNTLVIKTTSAALKNELNYNKQLIIQKVNDHLGEAIIKEVIIN